MFNNKEVKLENIISIYIVLTSIPFVLTKVFGVQNLAIYNILIFLLFSLCIIFKYRKKGGKKLYLIVSIIFICTQMISLIKVMNSIKSIDVIFELIYIFSAFIFFLLIFVFLYYEKVTKNQLLKISKTYIAISIIFCFYNMIINYKEMLSIGKILDPYSVNFTSFFENRNTFGFFLVFSIYSSVIVLRVNKSFKYRIFLIIILINLILTLSRGAILSVIVFFAIHIVLYYKKNFIKIYFYSISMFLCGLFIYFNENIINFINNIILRKQYGVTSRDEVWSGGLEIIKENFILGLGKTEAVNKIQSITGNHEFHNLYLQIFVERGVIIFIFYILILVYSLNKCIKIYKKDNLMGSIFISINISSAVYFLFESSLILTFGFLGGITTLFIILLPILYENSIR